MDSMFLRINIPTQAPHTRTYMTARPHRPTRKQNKSFFKLSQTPGGPVTARAQRIPLRSDSSYTIWNAFMELGAEEMYPRMRMEAQSCASHEQDQSTKQQPSYRSISNLLGEWEQNCNHQSRTEDSRRRFTCRQWSEVRKSASSLAKLSEERHIARVCTKYGRKTTLPIYQSHLR